MNDYGLTRSQRYSATRRWMCHVSAIAFAAIVVAPIAFTVFDREPPFLLRDGHTVPPGLKAGQPYQFSWEFVPRRQRDCDGIVHWRIIDSQGTLWATPSAPSLFTAVRDTNPRRIVGRERTLPSGIAPGPIKLKSSMEFICNWTQHFWPIRVTFPDVESTVLP